MEYKIDDLCPILIISLPRKMDLKGIASGASI